MLAQYWWGFGLGGIVCLLLTIIFYFYCLSRLFKDQGLCIVPLVTTIAFFVLTLANFFLTFVGVIAALLRR